MSTLAECVGRYWIAQTLRPPDRPQRAIRVAMRHTATWRRDSHYLSRSWKCAADLPDVVRCDLLAATGEHLRLERVGLVVG